MKTGKISLTLMLMGFFLVVLSNQSSAQLKVRYINTDRILAEFPEAQEVQKQLDELKKNYENEFQQKQQEAQALLDEIQNQSLLLSPEKKAAKERELQNTQAELERYYYEKLGPQGEYFQANKKLTDPLIEKINTVIKRIGEEEGYDFILDVVQGVVLFSKPDYDITQRVLDELNKAQ